MSTNAGKFAAILLISAAAAATASLYAADQHKFDAARAGIQAAFDKAKHLMMTGFVAKVPDALYEDDLMITGEGEENLYPSLQSFRALLESYLHKSSDCSVTILDPIRQSGNLAAAFATEHCATGGQYADARALYVFRRGPEGWRVTMEMWGWGPLGIAK